MMVEPSQPRNDQQHDQSQDSQARDVPLEEQLLELAHRGVDEREDPVEDVARSPRAERCRGTPGRSNRRGASHAHSGHFPAGVKGPAAFSSRHRRRAITAPTRACRAPTARGVYYPRAWAARMSGSGRASPRARVACFSPLSLVAGHRGGGCSAGGGSTPTRPPSAASPRGPSETVFYDADGTAVVPVDDRRESRSSASRRFSTRSSPPRITASACTPGSTRRLRPRALGNLRGAGGPRAGAPSPSSSRAPSTSRSPHHRPQGERGGARVLLERRLSKDQILELYLNRVYVAPASTASRRCRTACSASTRAT